MREPFFIVSPPRCRTAWLANLFTYGPSFCHHDATRLGVSAASLIKLFSETETEFVGDSDSGLTAIPYEINHHFPNSKWVIIWRDSDQVAASYQKHFTHEPYPFVPALSDEGAFKMANWCKTRIKTIASIVPDCRKLVVRFDELNQEEVIRSMWEFCLPDVPFNKQRWEMLETFRVNIISSKVRISTDLLEQVKGNAFDFK